MAKSADGFQNRRVPISTTLAPPELELVMKQQGPQEKLSQTLARLIMRGLVATMADKAKEKAKEKLVALAIGPHFADVDDT